MSRAGLIGGRPDFALLFLVLFTVAAGNTALQSVLPSIGREIGIPDVLVAAIFSFSALMWTLSAPFWAEQSDKRGRKKLVEVGMAGYFVSTAFCAAVILAGVRGLIGPLLVVALFAAFRALFGLFGSASSPAAQAYVAARTSKAERTAALSVLASAFGLGTIVGPAVAPLFVLPWVTLSGPLIAFALIALAVLVVVARLLPRDYPNEIGHTPGSPAGGRRRLSWFDPRIRPFVLYGLFVGNAQAATMQTLGFFIIDESGRDPVAAQPLIGIAMMAGAGATLLAQWGLIPMFAMGPRQLVRWGAALALVGTAGLALADSFYAITISTAIAMLGYGFARPGFSAGASLAVELEDQGAAAGAVTAVNGAAFIAAPTIGVALYQIAQPVPYALGVVLLATMLVYALRNQVLSTELDGLPGPAHDEAPPS